MSGDRPRAILSLFLASAAAPSGAGAAEAVPDPAFLEYLGMWEESDEEWLLINEGIERETDAMGGQDEGDGESAENVDEHANRD